MNNSINDGGPAYPTMYHDNGMSLRDWFAGQALPVLISAYTFSQVNNYVDHSEVIKEAYKIADAMIAAREADQ